MKLERVVSNLRYASRDSEAFSLRVTRVHSDTGAVFKVYTTYLGEPEHFETMAQADHGDRREWLQDITERTGWSTPERYKSVEDALAHHCKVICTVLGDVSPERMQVIHDWLLETA